MLIGSFLDLCNRCTFIRRAKSEFDLAATTENRNNPRKFCKAVKSLSPSEIHNGLPQCMMKGSVVVSDKSAMLECFNAHFIASGSLFERQCPQDTSVVTNPMQSSVLCPKPAVGSEPLCFTAFSDADVHRALVTLDPL